MQIAFGDKFTYERVGPADRHRRHGPLPVRRDAEPGRARPGPGPPRRGLLDLLRRRCSSSGPPVPIVEDEFRRVEVGYLGAATLLCALLYVIYRRPHGRAEDTIEPGSDRGDGAAPGGRRRGQLSPARRRRPGPGVPAACGVNGPRAGQRVAGPHRDDDVARARWGSRLAAGRRPCAAPRSSRRRGRRRSPCRRASHPSVTSISSIRYSGATSTTPDLRVQREPRHLGPARLVRRDHAVGSGAQQLLLGVLALARATIVMSERARAPSGR